MLCSRVVAVEKRDNVTDRRLDSDRTEGKEEESQKAESGMESRDPDPRSERTRR